MPNSNDKIPVDCLNCPNLTRISPDLARVLFHFVDAMQCAVTLRECEAIEAHFQPRFAELGYLYTRPPKTS